MYNTRNDVIRWPISTSIKVELKHFSLALPFSDIKYYMISKNCVTLKIQVKVPTYSIRNGAIWKLIPDFLFHGNINICPISHHLQDIWKKNILNSKSFDLDNEGHGQGVEEQDLCHSTGNVRIHIGECFWNLATWEHTFTQKVTHTWTHAARDRGWWL